MRCARLRLVPIVQTLRYCSLVCLNFVANERRWPLSRLGGGAGARWGCSARPDGGQRWQARGHSLCVCGRSCGEKRYRSAEQPGRCGRQVQPLSAHALTLLPNGGIRHRHPFCSCGRKSPGNKSPLPCWRRVPAARRAALPFSPSPRRVPAAALPAGGGCAAAAEPPGGCGDLAGRRGPLWNPAPLHGSGAAAARRERHRAPLRGWAAGRAVCGAVGARPPGGTPRVFLSGGNSGEDEDC